MAAERAPHPSVRNRFRDFGHEFARPQLLADALTHPSTGKGGEFERLEFLGDRVLGLVVAEMLVGAYPHEAEGALSRRLTQLVRRETVAAVARDIGLGDALELSRGEEESGGRTSPGVLADAAEAVIGAIFLDGGMAAARDFVDRHWRPLMEAVTIPPTDAKTRLQEFLQARGSPPPVYETVRVAGPSHEPVITVRVVARGPAVGSGDARRSADGDGPNRRGAEQAAAGRLLATLNGESDHG